MLLSGHSAPDPSAYMYSRASAESVLPFPICDTRSAIRALYCPSMPALVTLLPRWSKFQVCNDVRMRYLDRQVPTLSS